MDQISETVPECSKNAVLVQSLPLPSETPIVKGNYLFIYHKYFAVLT